MKIENSPENKARFIAQHWGLQVCQTKGGKFKVDQDCFPLWDKAYLELKHISSITDEEAIQIARLVYQRPNPHLNFKVVKKDEDPFLIHVEWLDETINCRYQISINRHGNINANIHFGESNKDKAQSFKRNIGENDLTTAQPVPYIAIVDLLRSKGYAVQWMDLKVEDLVQFGWIKLIQK